MATALAIHAELETEADADPEDVYVDAPSDADLRGSLEDMAIAGSRPAPGADADADAGDLLGGVTEEVVIGEGAWADPTGEGRDKVGASDFEILSTIGQGAYGKVFMVRKTTGADKGKLFAMKVLRKASLLVKKKDAEHTKAERHILERLRHPFIVSLEYAFQTRGKLYLILQLARGGEVFTYMEQEGMFMEDVARVYLAELVVALQHVHSLGIIYRDLKPENILLDRDGHILLTDFGLSKVAIDEPDGKAGTFCGTIEYMAPETLAHQRYGFSVDWWSLGAVMYDMLVGQPPFTSNNRKATIERILNTKVRLPAFLTSDAKDLLRKLLRKNPSQRLGSVSGADEIKRHPFFRHVDWQAVSDRELEAPIIPVLTNEADVSNFDRTFTSMPPVDSPVDTSVNFSDSFRDVFKGFSYMAPSVMLDIMRPATSTSTSAMEVSTSSSSAGVTPSSVTPRPASPLSPRMDLPAAPTGRPVSALSSALAAAAAAAGGATGGRGPAGGA